MADGWIGFREFLRDISSQFDACLLLLTPWDRATSSVAELLLFFEIYSSESDPTAWEEELDRNLHILLMIVGCILVVGG